MNLLIQPYVDGDPIRQKELDEAIDINIKNEHITKIICFLESDLNVSHPKIIKVNLGRRLMYFDAFHYANRHLKDQICMLANADVAFDDTLRHVTVDNLRNKCLILTRHNLMNGKLTLHPEAGSQDAWMFVSPINISDMFCDFCLGKPGCDNRIAHELRKTNLTLCNPAKKIVLTHIHASNKINYDPAKDSIPPPYFDVGVTDSF